MLKWLFDVIKYLNFKKPFQNKLQQMTSVFCRAVTS